VHLASENPKDLDEQGQARMLMRGDGKSLWFEIATRREDWNRRRVWAGIERGARMEGAERGRAEPKEPCLVA